MSIITVVCSNPKCRTLFETQVPFSGDEGAQVRIYGLGAGACPRCGSAGDMSGTYRFDKDGLMELLSNPQFTPEVLYKLKQITKVAQEENYTPEKFKTEVASIGIPDSFVNLVVPQDAGDFYSFLGFLLYAIEKIWNSMKNRSSNSSSTEKKKKKKRSKKRNIDSEEYLIRKEYYKNQRDIGL